MKEHPKTVPVTTTIEPSQGWQALRLEEFWRYRELLYFLTWRDIKVRYKQTALGATWAMLQPLLLMAIFALFFARLAGLPSDGLPYTVFAYAALVPWSFFSQATTAASESLVGNTNLVTKIYFPRLLVPLGAVLSFLVDFAISFTILLAILGAYRIMPPLAIILIPLLILPLLIVTTFGLSAWLSALNVRYRDARYAVPFLIQVGFFVSPVVYPSSLVPGRWRWLYSLNPLVGIIEGMRWAALGGGHIPILSLTLAVVVSAALATSGLLYFRRVERSFADVI